MKQIYIKTEPGGRITFGALDSEQISLLKKSLEAQVLDSELDELSFNSSGVLDECEGVINSGDEGDFGNEGTIVFDRNLPCLGPKDDSDSNSFSDGVYVVIMRLSKCSIEFEFAVNDDFDEDKFEEVSVPVRLPENVVHGLYGHPNFNLISDFRYRGEPIDEYDHEVVDRGYDDQLTFFVIKDGESTIVYSNFNGDESWTDQRIEDIFGNEWFRYYDVAMAGKTNNIDSSIRNDLIQKLEDYEIDFEDVDVVFKSDREFVIKAAELDCFTFEFASSDLKSDREVVLEVVKRDGRALEHADVKFIFDRDVVLAAVENSGWALEYVDEEFKSDREIVLIAVNSDGPAIQFANRSISSDREVVLTAVSQNGQALEEVDDAFKSDREIVLAAVGSSGSALYFVNESLQSDPEVVLKAMCQDPQSICNASEQFGLHFDNEGMPTKCTATYLVYSSEKEEGEFKGVGEDAVDTNGYIIWTDRTWGDLIWELPNSYQMCCATLDPGEADCWEWFDPKHHPDYGDDSYPDVGFDNFTFGEEGSVGKGSEKVSYDEIDVEEYENFESTDSNIIELSTESLPSAISVIFDGGTTLEFSNNSDVWKVAFQNSNDSIEFTDYEQISNLVAQCLKLPLAIVREYLKEVNSEDVLDGTLIGLLEKHL